MILYELLNLIDSRNGLYTVIDTYDDMIGDDVNLYSGSNRLFKYSREELLPYIVTSAHIYGLSEDVDFQKPIPVSLDNYRIAKCDKELYIYVKRPNILSKVKYNILRIRNYISSIGIKVLLQYGIPIYLYRLFVDRYYIPWEGYEYTQSSGMDDDLVLYQGRENGGLVNIYNADINKRYKEPIFRVVVIAEKNDEYHNLINNGLTDITMAFTLEPEPKRLQNYDTFKRKLKGNIISEDRLNELVEFVKNNYELFIEAWYTHPSQFGTFSNGYDKSKVIPLKK